MSMLKLKTNILIKKYTTLKTQTIKIYKNRKNMTITFIDNKVCEFNVFDAASNLAYPAYHNSTRSLVSICTIPMLLLLLSSVWLYKSCKYKLTTRVSVCFGQKS